MTIDEIFTHLEKHPVNDVIGFINKNWDNWQVYFPEESEKNPT